MTSRNTGRHLQRFAAAITIFLLLFGLAGLWAGGSQETKVKKGKINLGAVHITFDPSYVYEGIQYDTFDRSYRQDLDQIAREKNVNFIHVEGGVDNAESEYAVQELLDLGVDGIVIFEQEPGMALGMVKKVQAAGIPVLVHGVQPKQSWPVPYVSFDDYGSCVELGKDVAQKLFLRDVVNGVARVLVLNTKADQTDISRADGFTAGFRSLVPGAQFLNAPPDTGTVESAAAVVAASLQQTPPANVIFATTDFQAEGAMAALSRFGPGSPAHNVILAGVGGSGEAMSQLLQADSPWKAEVGLGLKDLADQSYNVMIGMIKGQLPRSQDKLYLVKSPVFVQPTKEEVRQYMLENHNEQLP